MIKNIVFDFGGVLVDWNPKYLYKEIFKDDERMNFFLQNVCTSEWNIEQDRGRTLADGTRSLQDKFPEFHEEIGLFYSQWETMLVDKIAENTQLLPRLKESYRLFGLTNWSDETFPIALRRFSFFQEFEGIVVSGIEKIIKPDAALYQILLDRYDIKAEESLFIDDNRDNIVAADKLGFATIHFTDGVVLEDKLREMNIIK